MDRLAWAQINPSHIGAQKTGKPSSALKNVAVQPVTPAVEGTRLTLADVSFSAARVPAVKQDAWKSAMC